MGNTGINSGNNEGFTRVEFLDLYKGNFNFLITNYLGLIDSGTRNKTTGKYELTSDILHSFAQQGDFVPNKESSCPVEIALLKKKNQEYNQQNLIDLVRLGKNSAHIWHRAKTDKKKIEEDASTSLNTSSKGEVVHFSHSYISSILSLLPIPNQGNSSRNNHKTIMDIFDEELEKIENSSKPSIYCSSIVGDNMKRVISLIMPTK